MEYNKIITKKNVSKYNKNNKKKHKKHKFRVVFHPRIRVNVKQEMIKWLLTDMGDNMILLDFLRITFEKLILKLNIIEYKTTEKKFFTHFVNWIYKYTL